LRAEEREERPKNAARARSSQMLFSVARLVPQPGPCFAWPGSVGLVNGDVEGIFTAPVRHTGGFAAAQMRSRKIAGNRRAAVVALANGKAMTFHTSLVG
jgi:hypothetical protein